jgi:hypothetical protein
MTGAGMAGMGSAMAGDGMFVGGSRCGLYGPGVIDGGLGLCGQGERLTGGYVRIGPADNAAASRAASAGWALGQTSHAAMRSVGAGPDGTGMVPGAGESRHLRLEGDPYLH